VVFAAFVARLPLSMMGLATVFFVEQKTGSAAAAGAAVAAFSVTAAALAPARGRWVDRHGIREGLVPLVLLHASATAAFLFSEVLSDRVVFLVLVAGLGGATAPPISAAMRALWPSLVGPHSIDAAYGAEAVLQEVSYLLGPVLVGLLVAVASAATAIAVAAVLTAVGGLAFARHEAVGRLARAAGSRRGPLRSTGVKVILAALFFTSLAGGVLELAIPTFADRHSAPAAAGVLIAAMAGASLVAGLWYSSRRWRATAAQRFIGASAIATLGYLLMVPAASLPALAVGALVVGFTSAPSIAAVYSILDDVAQRDAGVEAVTWITTATAAGAALGAALGGSLIDAAGMRASLTVGVAALAVATSLTFALRARLAGVHPPRPRRPVEPLAEATEQIETIAGIEGVDRPHLARAPGGHAGAAHDPSA
jgi:MFS family permease